MIKNKKILFVIIILALVGISLIRSKGRAPDSQSNMTNNHQHEEVEYWTCSMHPQVRQDGPGQCPICGMNLIPVKATDKGKIIVNESNQTYLGMKSVPAEYRHLVKQIRLPAKIGHDFELYRLQQEYLSAVLILDNLKNNLSDGVYNRQLSLVDTAALRLKLLGFSEDQVKDLRESKEADKSLIYPDHAKTWAQADVYEQDIKLVKPGQTTVLKIKGYQKEFSGTVFAIEEIVDPQTRSATARIVLDNPGVELKHGVYADLILDIDLGHQSLSVPTLSVIDTGARKVVYIDEGEGRYQFREVQTGAETQGFVQIKEGIKEGEMVVTNGNFLLDSQTTLTGGQTLLYSGSEEVDTAAQQHRH